MIGFLIFTPLFFAWVITFGFAECGIIKNNKLTKWTGIDTIRGVEPYNVEDYYG